MGGADFYKKALVQLDAGSLKSATMQKVLDHLQEGQGLHRQERAGPRLEPGHRDGHQGEAGMQLMGDWAKGEFLAAGKVPGKDFACVAAPGTAKAFTYNVDSSRCFKLKDPANQKAQQDLAAAIMSTEFQEVFNLNKGSIPGAPGHEAGQVRRLRQDLAADFVASSKSAGSLVPSIAHGMAVPSAVEGAMKDVVSQFWNDDKMTVGGRWTNWSAARPSVPVVRSVRGCRSG